MKVVGSKSRLVFTVKVISNQQRFTVYAQKMVTYSSTHFGELASQEFQKPMLHFDSTYHSINAVAGAQKRRDGYEVLVSWVGLEDSKHETWKQLQRILEDVSGTLYDVFNMDGNQNLKQESLESFF